MPMSVPNPVLAELRARIQRLEGGRGHGRAALPLGLAEIDRVLPESGLALGALHEVAGGGNGAIDGAAAALFGAGIAARTKGKVLWCVTRQDLFAPVLAQADPALDRVIYVEAGDEKTVLACFEEGLRHGGLGAVIAEVARLSMTSSRRLQLAAESTGAIGIAVPRWRRQAEAADFGQPTASVTHWRVSTLPSSLCRCPASDGLAGSSSSSGAAPATAPISKLRLAMQRVVSLFPPTWPTDRVRRRLGVAAPPTETPLVLCLNVSMSLRRRHAESQSARKTENILPSLVPQYQAPLSIVVRDTVRNVVNYVSQGLPRDRMTSRICGLERDI
jgi:protein ImuA